MNTVAPTLYPVTDSQLKAELAFIDVTGTTDMFGVKITTGVHVRDSPRPVTIVSRGSMHIIALPGGD